MSNGKKSYYYQLIDFGCSLQSIEQKSCSFSECGLKNWKNQVVIFPLICGDETLKFDFVDDIKTIALLFYEQFLDKNKLILFCGTDDPNDYSKIKNDYNINMYRLVKIIFNMFFPKEETEINNIYYNINLFFDDVSGLFNNTWKTNNSDNFDIIKERYNKLLEHSLENKYLFLFLS